MSRSFYDIDPAGEVLCTYTDGGGREALKSVSVDALSPRRPTATGIPIP